MYFNGAKILFFCENEKLFNIICIFLSKNLEFSHKSHKFAAQIVLFMKKLVLSSLLCLMPCCGLWAAHRVSTLPEQRHVVLEEFTGIRCVYCPQGHKIAAQLLADHPSQCHVISVHYGSYAEAVYADQPDFTTAVGDTLGQYYQATSFPCGMVNRREYDSRICTSRSLWQTQYDLYAAETAPVNLWAEATYDASTRLVSVDVEGYAVSAYDGALSLAVALTQDSILGPQSGGLMGDEYPHNHVLRDYINRGGVWGDSLGVLEAGTYFARHYEYTLPETFANTDADARQSEVTVLLTDAASHEVVNAAGSRLLYDGYHVSTQPEARHALIEEFTGIYCGNCPDGHAIVSHVLLAQPDLVNAIAIHSGHYAEPGSAAMPDFRTAAGDSIADWCGADSYPSGMINRNDPDETGIVIGRSTWVYRARCEATQQAAVNLWMQSSYDGATRMLSIDVEGYVLETDTLNLAIAITQNHIIGYQNGGSALYDHMHVLRGYVTPVWGDSLGILPAGTFFSRHYDYEVPAVVGNLDVVPEQLELVGIVTDPQHTVLNSLGNKPASDDYALPLSCTLEAYKVMPSRNWGYDFVQVYLVNDGSVPITSATFSITLNDEHQTEADWTGAIMGQERGVLTLPVDWLSTQDNGRNEYSIVLTSLNGQPCEAQTVSGTFNAMIEVDSDVIVKIKADYDASDNRFLLCDTHGNVVYECGPYPDSKVQTTYTDTLHLELGQTYCFDVSDAWGNGILHPRGNLKWYDMSGTLLAQQLEFSSYGYRIFFRRSDVSVIQSVHADEASAPAATRLVFSDGQLHLLDATTGRTYTLDGRTASSRQTSVR